MKTHIYNKLLSLVMIFIPVFLTYSLVQIGRKEDISWFYAACILFSNFLILTFGILYNYWSDSDLEIDVENKYNQFISYVLATISILILASFVISFFYGICVFITSVIFLIIGVYTYKGSAEHYFESKSKQN